MLFVMGFCLLTSAGLLVKPARRLAHSIRDLFWAATVLLLMVSFGLGLLAEGLEQMGWT